MCFPPHFAKYSYSISIVTVAIVIAVIIMTLVYWSIHVVTRRIEVLESLTFLVTRVT